MYFSVNHGLPGTRTSPSVLRKEGCVALRCFDLYHYMTLKVLHPSDPNYWKNVEWIPYVFSKEYCSECQTNRVMGQQFGTITYCHL